MSRTRVQILAREPVQKYSFTTARTVEWCAGMEQVNKGRYSNLHVFHPAASRVLCGCACPWQCVCVCLGLISQDTLVTRVVLKLFTQHKGLRRSESRHGELYRQFGGCVWIIDGLLLYQIICNVSNQSWFNYFKLACRVKLASYNNREAAGKKNLCFDII